MQGCALEAIGGRILKSLREQHCLKHSGKSPTIAIGDVVLAKDEERNRRKWKMGIVNELITGRNGVVRDVKRELESHPSNKQVQYLYPPELTCDRKPGRPGKKINPDATKFTPQRQTCRAAVDA